MARKGRPPKPLNKAEVRGVFAAHGGRITPVIEHFGVHIERLIPLLPKGAYTPPPKPSPQRTYIRTIKYRTPRSIRRLDAWLRKSHKSLSDITLDEALTIMRAPTPKGARILADLRNQNGPETLSYSQAAELLDCGKMYLHRLNKKLRAGSARAVPLPMHPQFRNKIDAGQLLDPKNGLYQRYLNSITDAEASELIMRVRRLTPSGARKALYALDVPRVKMHIVGGGYDFQEFKAALRRRSAVRPTNDYTRQVLLAWARNPETLKVPPTKRTIRPVLHMLNEGIFSMPNSRLLNASSKMLSTHRGALTGDSRYAMVPGEPARSLPLKQNTAALAALGIDPATRVDGTTLPHVMRNADRVVLGRTIVKLMQSGTLPKHLPRVTGPERAAADAALFKALRLMAPRTPGLTAIQSVLETRVSEM